MIRFKIEYKRKWIMIQRKRTVKAFIRTNRRRINRSCYLTYFQRHTLYCSKNKFDIFKSGITSKNIAQFLLDVARYNGCDVIDVVTLVAY